MKASVKNPASVLEALGALPAEDRLWILSELDSRERLRLGELLGEEHGIAPSVVTQQIVQDSAADGASPALDADRWAELLREEPDWVIRPVLQQIEEPLREKVVKRFQSHRRKLLQLPAGDGLSPALNRLIVELSQQALKTAGSQPVVDRPSLFDGLVRRLRGEP